MTLGKAAVHGSLFLTIGLLWTLMVWPQELTPAAPLVRQEAPLIDPALLEFVKVFGFGAMIFVIWWGDYRKIGKLQRMVESYEQLTKNYESVTKECRDTMLLTMDVNARMAGKIEFLLAAAGKTAHES